MIRKFFFFVFALFIFFNLKAQQSYPNTFLWRISGNGLTKPSYLFGTMHLQDRKLFSFGDSIYKAMELSDGFAIEINPVEMMDSVLKIFDAGDKSPLIKDIISKQKFDKIAKQLEKKLRIPADQITLKKISEERNSWLAKYRRKDDMQTFLDMYLYTIAQNQGKYVSGIEDIGDQIGLFDDVGSIDVEEYLKEDDKSRLQSIEVMKKIYINRDLSQLAKMTYGTRGTLYYDEVLVRRNIKMARRMDSLAHIRNTFFAVGAAHLPGDSGVISLLQKRGFTVEPVISSTYLKPEDYKYTIKEAKWIKIEDQTKMFSVEMPGQPTTLSVSEIVPIQLFVDLSNMYAYGVSLVPTSGEPADTLFSRFVASYKTLGFDLISQKKVQYPEGRGLEMIIKNEEYFLKFRLTIKGNKLFMLIFGAQSLEKLDAPQGIKYFNSLSIQEDIINRETSWQLLADSLNAFTLLMPGKPIHKFVKGTKETMYDVYTYTATDYKDGSFYIITVQNTLPDYFVDNDSSIFEGVKSRMNVFTDSGISHISTLSANDYRGYKIVAAKKEEGAEFICQVYLVIRGNRIYMPMVITQKSKEGYEKADNFFKNFSLLPYQKSEWKEYLSPLNNFRTFAPGKFEVQEKDSSSENNKQIVYSYDNNTVISYGVETEPYSRFYWNNSDSGFFRKLVDKYKNEQDSLMNYRLIKGDNPGVEFLVQIHNSGLHKKIKAMFNGDTLYTIYSHFPNDLINDKNVNSFFSEFRFTTLYPNTIFKNKRDLLFSSLKSRDSTLRSEAIDVLDQVEFTNADISFLHDAWLVTYPSYEDEYRSINYQVGQKIKELNDPSTIDFIKDNYVAGKANPSDLQMNMLEVLANYKTERSYLVLKQLVTIQPPRTGSSYQLSNLWSDSLLLSKRLFPEISNLYADSIVGSAIAKLSVQLVDSNLLTIKEITPFAELIYSLAKAQIKETSTDPDAFPSFNNYVLDLLEKMNTKQSIKLLNNFLQARNNYIKYNAAIALLRLNQTVSPLVLQKFAGDNEYRTDLYQDLKKLKKEALFPKVYMTQQKFAESYIYVYASEDYDISGIVPVGERLSKPGGELKRYYLFKINLVENDKKVPYLAICGPFSYNKSHMNSAEDDPQVYIASDEIFKTSLIETQFREFMRSEKERLQESVNK